MSESGSPRLETARATIPLIEPPVQTMHLADGRILTWLEFGDPEGRPVLFFHGGGSMALEAGVFQREAVAYGIRLIATNRPGAGGSSLKPGRPVVAYADDVRELLDHLHVATCACFGNSNGGAMTLAIASGLSDRVIGAVPMNPTLPWYDPLARQVSAQSAAMGYWALKNVPWALAGAARSSFRQYRKRRAAGAPSRPIDPGAPPGTEEDVAELFLKVAEGITSARLLPELAWAASDWGFDYYAIPTRLDFYCGVLDTQAPFALVLADRNPNAQFHYFSHGHHGFVHPAARQRIIQKIVSYFGGEDHGAQSDF